MNTYPSLTDLLNRLDDAGVDVGNDAMRRAFILVASAYRGRDRDVWGGDRAITFWDRLPDRVRTSCYRGPLLVHWWEAISRTLGVSQPGRMEDRETLATALAAGDDALVLEMLRTGTEAICLLVRLSMQLDPSRAQTNPETESSLVISTTTKNANIQGAML